MPHGHRRSREGWVDTMEAGPADPPAHVHRLPPVVRLALAGLTAAVFLLLVAVGLMAVYVYQANQYVQGRGDYRDAEAQRLERSIRDGLCDLLDQLPPSPLLDVPRGKYGCGPGVTLDGQTPESPPPTAPPAGPAGAVPARPTAEPPRQEGLAPTGQGSSSTAPTPPPAAAPAAPLPPPAASPPALPPDAAPAPPSLIDLEPLTDPVCQLLRVCL